MGSKLMVDHKVSGYLDRLIIVPVLFVLVFLFCYFVGQEFVYGDQEIYRDVYGYVAGKGVSEAYEYYRSRIYSGDLGHFALVWLFASYFDKDLLMSFLNGILACCSYLVFRVWGGGRVISLFIVCSGAYFMALYFSAERLKLSFIFVALFWLYLRRAQVASTILAVLAFISHGQALVFFASMAVKVAGEGVLTTCSTLKVRLRVILVCCSVGAVVALGAIFFGGYLVDKFYAYYVLGYGSGLWKVLPFVLGGMICAKKVIEPLLVFLVPVSVVAMLGADRFLIMVYFVFLYYGFKLKSGYNLFVVLSAVYYAVSGAQYVSNVFNYGVNVAP